MEYLGIYSYGHGIGDKIQFTSIPENYFKTTGNKIVDLENSWIFDFNPYVIRGITPTLESINLWQLQFTKDACSKEDLIAEFLKIKTFLRHPRLYRFEDITPNPYAIAVHTNGKSRGGIMPDEVIFQIIKNYPKHEIFQIGGISDKNTPFINKKGLDIWQSAELIASCGTFIGINSSMMNLAKCYPKIRKKVLFNHFPVVGWNGNEELKTFKPVTPIDTWIDYNWEYFNFSENDIGISNSYLKI